MTGGQGSEPTEEAVDGPPKKRRKRAELKQLVLEAGLEVLIEEGLDIGVGHITYSKVFDHLEATKGVRVTRGSVHERIWDSQRDFQLDVVRNVAKWDPVASTGATLSVGEEVLAAADTSTHHGRAQALKEIARRCGRTNIEHGERDDLWSLWQGIIGAFSVMKNNPPEAEAASVAMQAGYREVLEAFSNWYAYIVERVGLRVVPGPFPDDTTAIKEFAITATALADGFTLRRTYLAEQLKYFPTGPNGETEEWDSFSFALWQLAQSYFDNPTDDEI